MAGRAPTRSIEKDLWARGHEVIVGIDEVGRGAWAGPLMVGAAVLPRDLNWRPPALGAALAAQGDVDQALAPLEKGVFLRRLWGQPLDLRRPLPDRCGGGPADGQRHLRPPAR